MKRTTIAAALVSAAIICGPTTALAAGLAKDKNDLGKQEYDKNCAVCHGEKAKGDGPYREFISKIPDLTVLSKNNGGVFPISRVYEIVDGRQEIKAHGPRDMPIWGTDYSIRAAEKYGDVEYDPEAYVRTHILSLIDYLYRLQVK